MMWTRTSTWSSQTRLEGKTPRALVGMALGGGCAASPTSMQMRVSIGEIEMHDAPDGKLSAVRRGGLH